MTEINRNKLDASAQTQKTNLLFSSIARRYDLANHLLSLGLDFYWRKTAARIAEPSDGDSVLDVCCGTGDFAIALAKTGAQLSRIAGCDLSREMIEIAKVKTEQSGRGQRGVQAEFEWVVGDAMAMPFENESFDIVSCGFGVRNLGELETGLGQMYRVTRPGGKVCVLEFSMPKIRAFRYVYLLYLLYILPVAAGVITGKLKAFIHLSRTVVKWSREVDLVEKLLSAGFNHVVVKKLTFGVATIYVAHKQ